MTEQVTLGDGPKQGWPDEVSVSDANTHKIAATNARSTSALIQSAARSFAFLRGELIVMRVERLTSAPLSAPTRPGGRLIPSNPCLHSGGVKGDLMDDGV